MTSVHYDQRYRWRKMRSLGTPAEVEILNFLLFQLSKLCVQIGYYSLWMFSFGSHLLLLFFPFADCKWTQISVCLYGSCFSWCCDCTFGADCNRWRRISRTWSRQLNQKSRSEFIRVCYYFNMRTNQSLSWKCDKNLSEFSSWNH